MAVHPVIQAMLDKARAAGMPPLSAGSPDDARRLMAMLQPVLGTGVDVGRRAKIDIPTRSGSIRALLLQPKEPAIGLLVYFHGGGWVIGSLADYEVLARKLCAETGCAVLLPDYRLAPEHPFPAGPDDCDDTLLWAWAERRFLTGHDGAMIVGGDSAGGNLATVSAASLQGRIHLAGQVLIYPVTDTDPDRPSYQAYGSGDVPLSRADMLWFFGHYAPQSALSDPRIAPLRAASLQGQPPAIVITAEHDVLRDEGEAYAARLVEAGVPTISRRYSGMTHGFIRYHDMVDVAGQALHEMAADIVRLCRTDVRDAA